MDARIARVKWRCRRGMRELDALLLTFVDRVAQSLSAAEMARFEEILELPDPVLHAYLLRRSAPPDAATDALLERIRACAHPSS